MKVICNLCLHHCALADEARALLNFVYTGNL